MDNMGKRRFNAVKLILLPAIYKLFVHKITKTKAGPYQKMADLGVKP
jgi:hypothetical protein